MEKIIEIKIVFQAKPQCNKYHEVSEQANVSSLRADLKLYPHEVVCDDEGFIYQQTKLLRNIGGGKVYIKDQIVEQVQLLEKNLTEKEEQETTMEIVRMKTDEAVEKLRRGESLSEPQSKLLILLTEKQISRADNINNTRIEEKVKDYWASYFKEAASNATITSLGMVVRNKLVRSSFNGICLAIKNPSLLPVFEASLAKLIENSGTSIRAISLKGHVASMKIDILVAAGFALWQAGSVIYNFCKGAISGQEAFKSISKIITSQAGSCGCSILGGSLLAGIGAATFGPIGLFAGTIIGSAIGAFAGGCVGCLLNNFIWSLFEEGKDEQARKEIIKKARQTLNVVESATWNEVLSTWKSQILLAHPDKHPNATADEKKDLQAKFSEIHQAFCILRLQYVPQVGSKKIEEDIKQKSCLELKNDIIDGKF